MKKQFIVAILTVIVLVLPGCRTNIEEKNGEYTEYGSDLSNTSDIAGENTTEENTTENNTTEESTTEESTTEEDIPGVVDFDLKAERVDLPEDELLEGYDFSDAVFIGDSRTEGLTVYSVLTTSTVLATRGLMACSILDEEFIETENDDKLTALEYLSLHDFKKVYIMLGINELGCDINIYVSCYKQFIDEIRILQPEIEIYILPIIPMVEERTDEIYNNEIIAKFNEELKKICIEKNVPLINVSAALINKEGTLNEELSRDGIHLNTKGLIRFVNYLILATGN